MRHGRRTVSVDLVLVSRLLLGASRYRCSAETHAGLLNVMHRILIALVVAAVTPMLLFSGVDAEPGDVAGPELRQRVQKEGKARVIVQLRLPGASHVPEGRLSSAGAVSRQRADIASVQTRLMGRLTTTSHRLFHRHQTVPLLTLEVGPAALAELTAASLYVEKITEDGLSAPAAAQSVPLTQTSPGGTGGFDGTGWMVAILDTGVDTTHPFIGRKVVEAACYSSTVKNTSTTLCPNGQGQQIGPGSGVNCLIDTCWHGTHVAGIIAGNGGGVAFSGIAPGAEIMAIQVFSRFDNAADCHGAAPCVLAWDSDLIAALERVYALRGTHRFAAANLNLSGGGLSSASCDGEPIKKIIDNLRSVGIATVVAAGNDSATEAMSFPACVSTTVSVGSLNKNGDLSDFSNISALTSLLAPGEAITSSIPHSAYAAVNGTSMAAASVAGAWALLRQAAPGASVDQILAALQSTGLAVTDTRSGGSVTKPSAHVVQALSSLGTAPQIQANNPGALAGAPHMTKGEMVGGSTVSAAASATLTVAFNGQLRDRVGQGNVAVGADGVLDGTLTATLSAPGGRTVTGLRLDSSAPGTWDTTSESIFWALGTATTLDGPLLNAPGSLAVNFPVTDGGSFVIFASDLQGIEFLPGRTLTLTATFSDGSTTSAAATVAAAQGFTTALVTSGLNAPTAMAFAPDGRLFVAEQGGRLRVIKSGALLPTEFLSVTTTSSGERGLLGIAFDPNFASNHFVYVYYTATSPTVHNRVSRFIANGDVAVPGSESVILELNPLSDATNHNGGAIHFGLDGKLYIGVGENANGANAQTLSNLLGKMLRINPDGSIPSDNPFFTTASGDNRAIWALGLRNPFTFAIEPTTGRIFINDVGENSQEEINDGIAGSNYGWPATEGPTSNPSFRSPLFAYGHGAGPTTGCAIAGAAFYRSATALFPADFIGDYFFADLCSGWIRRFDPASGVVTDFASGFSSPVDLQVGADGGLYVLPRGGGAVHVIRFGAF